MAVTDYNILTTNYRPWYERIIYQDESKYRGMFCLLRTYYDVDSETNHAVALKNFFGYIKQQLDDEGILEWLKDNGFGIESCHVAALLDPAPWQLRVVVLIDLPHELRTMYTLRFK